MRRVGAALVIALMVLTGCGGKVTKEAPPPAVQVPSQSPAPPPDPAPAAPVVDLCDQKIPLAERQKLLPDVLLHGGQPGSCVRITSLPDQHATLAVGTLEKDGFLAAIAWAPPGGEAKAALIPPPAGGWEIADNLGVFGPISFVDGRLSLLVQELSSGTGVFSRLVHVAEDPFGALVSSAVTDVYEKAWFRFIQPDLILLNYRGNPGPQAWECNACLTANDQILWRWDGKQLTQVGARRWSEPYLTVNLMLGALKSGDTKAAAQYVTDPALVEQAVKLVGPDPMAWNATSWSEAYGQIQDAERTNWDLLPTSVRTTVPETKYDITLTKDGQKVVFHTTRTDKGWLVSGIN